MNKSLVLVDGCPYRSQINAIGLVRTSNIRAVVAAETVALRHQ